MEIIPIPLTDQPVPLSAIRSRVYFVLDDIVDENILRDALDKLIRHHWRKLGARLVTRPADGRLEYHLPRTFDDDDNKYRLFGWSSKDYGSPIDTILGHMPKPTNPDDGPTLHPYIADIEKWLTPSNWPLGRKYEAPDTPMLVVHLSLFTDASVVALNVPHTLADMLGLGNVVKAWLGLVKGETPPPMLGYNTDPLITENTKSCSKFTKEEARRIGRVQRMSKWKYSLAILGLVVPELVLQPKEVRHTLFLPLPLVESLRERQNKVLKEKSGKDYGYSNTDIVDCVLFKLTQMHRKSSKMYSFSTTVNLRGRVPYLERDNISFIHNALQYSTARIEMCASTPLSELLYHHRQARLDALDPNDIERTLAVMREIARLKRTFLICEPFESSCFISSWTAAWKGIDFGVAMKTSTMEKEEHTTKEKKRTEMLVLGETILPNTPARFGQFILSRTAEGYYCTFMVSKKTLKLVKKYLEKDPMLENF